MSFYPVTNMSPLAVSKSWRHHVTERAVGRRRRNSGLSKRPGATTLTSLRFETDREEKRGDSERASDHSFKRPVTPTVRPTASAAWLLNGPAGPHQMSWYDVRTGGADIFSRQPVLGRRKGGGGGKK